MVIDITDPTDPRVDDFRDLNSVDRRPDLPTGKGLVIAEGVLVVQRMLASRFTPHGFLGTDRRLAELAADLATSPAPFYRASAEVMDELRGDRVAVLVGAEGPGLTETAMRAADVRVRIPMSRGTDSLNVATAAALAFYERVRASDMPPG